MFSVEKNLLFYHSKLDELRIGEYGNDGNDETSFELWNISGEAPIKLVFRITCPNIISRNAWVEDIRYAIKEKRELLNFGIQCLINESLNFDFINYFYKGFVIKSSELDYLFDLGLIFLVEFRKLKVYIVHMIIFVIYDQCIMISRRVQESWFILFGIHNLDILKCNEAFLIEYI